MASTEQTLGSVQTGMQVSDTSFIETQFPVSKMSKESYAERTAKQSQTLTGLGKWWGRKPLVLCRAAILGALLPATDDPAADRDIFLRLMMMDDDGMLRRKSSTIGGVEVYRRLGPSDRKRYFEAGSTEEAAVYKSSLEDEERIQLQRRVFLSMSYDDRMKYCDRPEQVDGPSASSWQLINSHLKTNATSISELVRELGRRRFGHTPHVGDAFVGGGSIPFEAARLGCEAYGSDLSPIAALLTWASINIVGGGEAVAQEIREAQEAVYKAVDQKITNWGIEHREPDTKTARCWRADAYIYCIEVTCPECGWRVPMAPSWVVGKQSQTIVRLIPDKRHKRFEFEVESGVSAKALDSAANAGTAKDSKLYCANPECGASTPIKAIRGDGRGTFGDAKSLLRPWEPGDIIPREGDIFGERLYCVRWVDEWVDRKGKKHRVRHFMAPTGSDLQREAKVLSLLKERFTDWQKTGVIPRRRVEPGIETARLQRERGWTHWNHLFAPRQLLVNGLLSDAAFSARFSERQMVALLLGVGRCADWNSRLSRWHPAVGNEKSEQTFSNQALNTLSNYGVRPLSALDTTWFSRVPRDQIQGRVTVEPKDARRVEYNADLWITDPPYADAVVYDELSELFLSWYEGRIPAIFPEWYTDSKRALAVRGTEDSFRKTMVECYRRLAERMPGNGVQVVMFTHQDAGVWADLALILWAAGLRVTAAWCIATETTSELKEGNYVQGTVLLVLRKRGSAEIAFMDEVYREVEFEVRRQLDSMLALDDARDPNFSDTDYQLAAYAAALRVLTSRQIEDVDVSYELTKVRAKGDRSPIEELIRQAVRIACDHLVPHGLETHLWKGLTAHERFYLKGLETESHGEHRNGVYQELARGFGLDGYTFLLASTKANETRLRTASEFGRKELDEAGFGATLLRHALFATWKTAETESTKDGLTWLKTECPGYASGRDRLIQILEFLAALRENASMQHWHKDAIAAGWLAGALRNRQDNV